MTSTDNFIIIVSKLCGSDFVPYIDRSAKEVLSKCRKVVDVLRKLGAVDKNTIVNESKLSWTTVNSYLEELLSIKIIEHKDNQYYLNKDFCYEVGISIGVTEVKLSVLNTAFQKSPQCIEIETIIKEHLFLRSEEVQDSDKYICVKTPTNFIDCCNLTNNIIEGVLKAITQNYTLLSIGISLPGLMDKDTHVMEFSPNLSWLVNINVYSLIRRDLLEEINNNGALLGIYHDMDAVAVYEKESLSSYNNLKLDKYSDVLCLFMSYGIGSTLIKNNSLKLFSSSEHGHIMTSISPEKNISVCSCGHNCLENQIRNNVFNSPDIQSFYKQTTPDMLESISDEKYSQLCQYIGFLFNHIINTMRVSMIILSGRILNGIPQLKYDMDKIRIGNTIPALSKKCIIINGSSRLDIAAVGAAMISYYNITSRQSSSDLIISW